MYAEAILKKGEGRTLKSGGAWVYDNEIDRVEGDYENGDILAVKDFDGFFLGWAVLFFLHIPGSVPAAGLPQSLLPVHVFFENYHLPSASGVFLIHP